MNKEEFLQLVSKVSKGTATDAEIARCEAWFNSIDGEEGWNTEELGKSDLKKKYLLDQIQSQIHQRENGRTRSLFFRLAAAAVLILLGTGLFFYKAAVLSNTAKQITVYKNDVKPGSNKAYLTLASGERISLTDASHGDIADQSGVKVTKSANGELIYTIGKTNSLSKNITGSNTIETPKGGQYQISLPDGTKVWLNAASRLTYPVCFAAHGERSVELKGEAYFEVFKDKSHPFKVKSSGQEVEVLGTHFNINCYSDENVVKTTLLEGSVQIRNSFKGENDAGTVLKPGQQSILKDRQVKVKEVDPEEAIDWKNGEFVFTNESLSSILRKVARWYDVEIVYTGTSENPPTFTGSVSKFDQVSSLLHMLEKASKVRFTIEGKIIRVKQ
jgi:ferric-dicitrate binding protein FerR (iron transport regulator)